jgi:hypothetical protein
MVAADDSVFPNNIVSIIKLRTQLLDSELEVFGRPLRTTDPNQSVGITAAMWTPNERSQEMLGQPFSVQPTLSRYGITIQGFIRDMDEERGLNVHTVLARMLRGMLYTDNTLRVALSQLSSTLGPTTERSQRWGISQQRFFANEIKGEWLYLSILEFWLETETM